MVEGAERETQRLERQFAEEYKARGRHLASVVTESVDAPLTLANIQISGSKHTRPGFLQSVCSPYLPKPGQETLPLGEVLKRTRDLCDALRSFDIFKSVDAGLDEARDLAAQPGDVDLHVKVQEKGRLFLKTSTDVGNGEGSAVGVSWAAFYRSSN